MCNHYLCPRRSDPALLSLLTVRLGPEPMKLIQNLERCAHAHNAFAQLPNPVFLQIAEQQPGIREVVHALRGQAHDAGTGGVDCYRIISDHDDAADLCLSLDWPVSFHSNNPVYNREVRPDSAVNVEDRAR